MANALGIGVPQFIDQYTRLTKDRQSLALADKEDGSCIFLTQDNLCRVNAVKPVQCATFPYDWDVPSEYRQLCRGHWEDTPKNPDFACIHVLGHPNLPLDVEAHPADAQLHNCLLFCRMLAHLGIPYIYYGMPGSKVPAGGGFASTGQPTARWKYGNGWHRLYNRRLSRLLTRNRVADRRIELVASLYGAAQADLKDCPFPVLEPMVGYNHCWAAYRVFPSYSQQTAIYTSQPDNTWHTRFFDTVIPHFLPADEYHTSPVHGGYLLYLGRNVPDKGIDLARQCAEATGFPLRVEHDGWSGEAKVKLLAEAYAVLMPTLYLEPFGYVAIEAQMCGTPVITTDWGAFAETVLQGETGFRCRTAAEFQAALPLCASLDRTHIRRSAIARFSLTTIAPAFEKYFRFVWNVHHNGGYYAKQAFRNPSIWMPNNQLPLS